uniref:Uncharacterized protein n=1 Tax=Oryza punctata TaxID=4537 RepID=A0A0E0M075_ORYPU
MFKMKREEKRVVNQPPAGAAGGDAETGRETDAPAPSPVALPRRPPGRPSPPAPAPSRVVSLPQPAVPGPRSGPPRTRRPTPAAASGPRGYRPRHGASSGSAPLPAALQQAGRLPGFHWPRASDAARSFESDEATSSSLIRPIAGGAVPAKLGRILRRPRRPWYTERIRGGEGQTAGGWKLRILVG